MSHDIVDKQAAHDAFGQLCGIDRAFRLMRLWETATQTISGDKFTLHPLKRTTTDVFRTIATRDGYTEEEITAYLELP